ncbi:MAG: 16S rRNA (guanine(966)-N(2))-methyltransferase RsmD, partial [Candidatus Zophobacter franzmannii]|nr:16S rRNA (guanine(966)-N(2))-methyltransferase RsmD [Candidatus Zophobacter franzmannii]
MRIISGDRKGFHLVSVDGNTARPTTDFMREYIYSVLHDVEGFMVLDLFAGTGSVGLEALSRGAKFVDFVDFSSNAISAMLKNIEWTKFKEQSHIYRKMVHRYLKTCEKKYDLIILDPPYSKDLVNSTLSMILERQLINENGYIVIDRSTKEKLLPEVGEYLIKEKKKRAVTV